MLIYNTINHSLQPIYTILVSCFTKTSNLFANSLSTVEIIVLHNKNGFICLSFNYNLFDKRCKLLHYKRVAHITSFYYFSFYLCSVQK